MINLEQKTSNEIAKEISLRVKTRRKEKHWTQNELALRAGMSFASYKRFEQKGEISFDSIIKIAIALGTEKQFDELFAKKEFSSIQEIIALQKTEKRISKR